MERLQLNDPIPVIVVELWAPEEYVCLARSNVSNGQAGNYALGSQKLGEIASVNFLVVLSGGA